MPVAPAGIGWRHTKAKLAIKQAVPAPNHRERKRKTHALYLDGGFDQIHSIFDSYRDARVARDKRYEGRRN